MLRNSYPVKRYWVVGWLKDGRRIARTVDEVRLLPSNRAWKIGYLFFLIIAVKRMPQVLDEDILGL